MTARIRSSTRHGPRARRAVRRRGAVPTRSRTQLHGRAALFASLLAVCVSLAGCAGRAPATGAPARSVVGEDQLGFLRPVRIPVTAVATGTGLVGGETLSVPDSLLAPVAARVDSILADPRLSGARIGLIVVSPSTGQPLYERNADAALIPASNMKIVTSALALSILGPSFQFTTELATDGVLRGPVLDGDLCVRGRGDPTLTTEEIWKLVEQVEVLGITTITGDLVLDTSYFDSLSPASGEAADGDRAYQARTGALAPNFGSVAVYVRPGEKAGDRARVALAPSTAYVALVNRATTGSSRKPSTIEVERTMRRGRNTVIARGKVPAGSDCSVWNRNVEDPAGYFGALFSESLAKSGIRIEGCVRNGLVPVGACVLAEHRSKSLGAIVRDLNKYSNNFVAEQLLKAVSAHTLGPPGSTAGGAALASALLRSFGVDSTACVVADGSGLSRENRLAPEAALIVMEHLLSDFGTAPEFVASLSVGGIDGTLARRMTDEDLRGAVRAKTGLLDDVSALSGVLRTRSHGELLFSMISNEFACGPVAMHDIEERVLRAFERL